jgi:hypothetical protein
VSYLEYYCIAYCFTYLQGKIDNAKKTGAGAGKEAKLNEIDHKVLLDIVGEH